MFRVEILHTANCEGPDTWKQHQRTSGEETRPSRRLTTLVPRLKSCTRTHRKVHSWRPTCMYVLHLHTTRWRSSIFVIRKRENRKTADTVVMKKQHIYTTFPSKAIFNQNYVWWKWANGEKKNKIKNDTALNGGNRWSYHDRVKVIPLPFHISLLLLSWTAIQSAFSPRLALPQIQHAHLAGNCQRGLTAASVAGHTAKTGNNDDPRRKRPATRSPVGTPKQNSAEA